MNKEEKYKRVQNEFAQLTEADNKKISEQ